MIDWSKLKPYSSDQKRSFEELCYQIVYEEYRSCDSVTAIDGSGGDGGVEFYLTLENGDVWGWQCKFFGDTGRLSVSGRVESIENSLETACRNHPNLKKWFLCLKSNLTADSQSRAGKFSKGELSWFKNELPKKIPNGMSAQLGFWGESELNVFVRKYPAINSYFFEDIIFKDNWFKEHYGILKEQTSIKNKYESALHIQTNLDEKVAEFLGGADLANLVKHRAAELDVDKFLQLYTIAVDDLFSTNIEKEYLPIQNAAREIFKGTADEVKAGINLIRSIQSNLVEKRWDVLAAELNSSKLHTDRLTRLYIELSEFRDGAVMKPLHWDTEENEKDDKRKMKIAEMRRLLLSPFFTLRNYIAPYTNIFGLLDSLDGNALYVSGAAGMGKTHLAFSIFERQITQDLPAIFISGKDLRTKSPVDRQVLDSLGIPNGFSLERFLGDLNMLGRISGVRVPIIIDGLNESVDWNIIWKQDIEKILTLVKNKYHHVFIVLTYRSSYEDQLFAKGYFENGNYQYKVFANGFEDLDIETYLSQYNIVLKKYSPDAIGELRYPLYLRLFCQTKNPTRAKRVKVSFLDEDLFQILEEYLSACNDHICEKLELNPKHYKNFVLDKLFSLAAYSWEENTRSIPRNLVFPESKELEAFEGENLLIFRNWNTKDNQEDIEFTYDLLFGFILAKYLLKKNRNDYSPFPSNGKRGINKIIRASLKFWMPANFVSLLEGGIEKIGKAYCKKESLGYFLKSTKFHESLLNGKTKHPLFEDILRCLCVYLIKEDGIFLFQKFNDSAAIKASIKSIFEIDTVYVIEHELIIKKFLKEEFLNPVNSRNILKGLVNVSVEIENPLNFNFTSQLLYEMSMADRDLVWSEFIRERNHKVFSNFIEQFENATKQNDTSNDRLRLEAKKIMWTLTSNVRGLRDKATKALYWYARMYPSDFFELLEYSLSINDPYVSERMLAAYYGLAMAKHADLIDPSYKRDCLGKHACILFEQIFSETSIYPTTHILARDYVKRTIDIALLHYPELLSPDKLELLRYPYSDYPHKLWGKSDDRNEDEYRDGNSPIQMDFKNYTIGSLIASRAPYETENNDYQLVVSNIYWRIYDLGYSLKKFGEIDKAISRLQWTSQSSGEKGKIDRYGKKYAWIAFYEMAGYRHDMGLLDLDDFCRSPKIDIDPSFPSPLRNFDLLGELKITKILPSEKTKFSLWVEDKETLETEKILKIKSSLGFDSSGEWLLLGGRVFERESSLSDETYRDRDPSLEANLNINAVIVSVDEMAKLKEIMKMDDYIFPYPSLPETYYIFEGELPWSDLIQTNGDTKTSFQFNHKIERRKKESLIYSKSGTPLTIKETKLLEQEIKGIYWEKYADSIDSADKVSLIEITGETLYLFDTEPAKMISIAKSLGFDGEIVDIFDEVKTNEEMVVETEMTSFQSCWESYHSEINPSGSTLVPSKAICEHLELFLRPQTSDLFDPSNNIMSTAFHSDPESKIETTFLYIKKNALESYLKSTGKELVWLEWCEKRYFDGTHSPTINDYRNYCRIIPY